MHKSKKPLVDYIKGELDILTLADKKIIYQYLLQQIKNEQQVDIDSSLKRIPYKDYMGAMNKAMGMDIDIPTRKYPIPYCKGLVYKAMILDGYTNGEVERISGRKHSGFFIMMQKINYYLENPQYFLDIAEIWIKFQDELKIVKQS